MTHLDWEGKLTRMILGEVTVEMIDDTNSICLRGDFKEGLSECEWWGESTTTDFSNVHTWDLSHNMLTNTVFKCCIANKVTGREWPNVTLIDLSYNHLSPKCLPDLLSWARHFPNAKLKLSYNGFTKKSLETFPKDVRERIDISTEYDKALDIVEGKLQKKWRELKDWQNFLEKSSQKGSVLRSFFKRTKIEDDVLEEELTRGTEAYYKSLGYKDVATVNLGKVYRPDGTILLELDGLVVAEGEPDGREPILATVESKHNLTKDDIDDRKRLLSKFMACLQELPETCDKAAHLKYRMMWGTLNPLRGVTIAHFIGGVNVPLHVKNRAQGEGFHVLQYRGSRFDVAEPKKEFVPIPV